MKLKLQLNRETLRVLGNRDLCEVAGGSPTATKMPPGCDVPIGVDGIHATFRGAVR